MTELVVRGYANRQRGQREQHRLDPDFDGWRLSEERTANYFNQMVDGVPLDDDCKCWRFERAWHPHDGRQQEQELCNRHNDLRDIAEARAQDTECERDTSNCDQSNQEAQHGKWGIQAYWPAEHEQQHDKEDGVVGEDDRMAGQRTINMRGKWERDRLDVPRGGDEHIAAFSDHAVDENPNNHADA